MFFITRLTENTNLAVCIPPAEHIFNAARLNIAMAIPSFAALDVASRKRTMENVMGSSMTGENEEKA
jgi:Ras-related GTP-binding protein A/B